MKPLVNPAELRHEMRIYDAQNDDFCEPFTAFLNQTETDEYVYEYRESETVVMWCARLRRWVSQTF